MSFLTPLYIAGMLAVSLPIVLHLIRRTPKGRLPFSSLMFLTPSPPRLTRRSRLDQLLLLLLRGLALTLLALAFARPFWRASTESQVDTAPGRRVAVLLDTSASMRRIGVWEDALRQANEVLDELRPADRVALITFDDGVRTLVDFEETDRVEPGRRAELVRQRLAQAAPTWAETDLGLALVAAAEALAEAESRQEAKVVTGAQIMLISDLQQGSRLDSLDAFAWPQEVQLSLHPVGQESGRTNAGIHLVAGGDDQDAADGRIRVRVVNAPDATREQFRVQWIGQDGRAGLREGEDVYVPPGESRTVQLDLPVVPSVAAADPNADAESPTAESPTAEQSSTGESQAESQVDEEANDQEVAQNTAPFEAASLQLMGDDEAFDNTLHVAPRRQAELAIAYLGDDAADDTQGLRYYLDIAFSETPSRKVNIRTYAPGEPLTAPELPPPRLVVLPDPAVPQDRLDQLREYLGQGGRVLVVLRTADSAEQVARLIGKPELKIAEADGQSYAMLGSIDFGHAMFSAFADPRFSDFTKIQFWKHRRVQLDDWDGAHVLARFDNGDPAMIEFRQGEGTLWLWTSGWNPGDSQLARSSKFVPLLGRMLLSQGWTDPAAQYFVHDGVPLRARAAAADEVTVRDPDGAEHLLAQTAQSFDATGTPGVYTLASADKTESFAVNLAASESLTSPLDSAQLEQRGVLLAGKELTAEEEAQQQRQMRDVELEGQQKMWRHLILIALVALIGETWLAGRRARASSLPPGELS
jgi:hypothetical protein